MTATATASPSNRQQSNTPTRQTTSSHSVSDNGGEGTEGEQTQEHRTAPDEPDAPPSCSERRRACSAARSELWSPVRDEESAGQLPSLMPLLLVFVLVFATAELPCIKFKFKARLPRTRPRVASLFASLHHIMCNAERSQDKSSADISLR